jgi:murein DD-endopeptidase MepM/ murein hydrolase activator NlpD
MNFFKLSGLIKKIIDFPVRKILVSFMVFLIIPTVFISSNYFIPRASLHGQTMEEQLEQIKKDREETQKKIQETKKQEQSYLAEVKSVETTLLASLSELDGLNDKMAKTKSEVDKGTIELVLKEQELMKIDEELNERGAVLNKRIASIYKNRATNILEILLKAQDFIEFISRLKLMNLLASQDAVILKEIKDKKTANLNIKKVILDMREAQKDKNSEIAKILSEAEIKQREVESIYEEKSNLLSKTRADKNALIAIDKEFEIQEAEVKRILESYKYGNAPGDKFMWPVAGYLKSSFGMRYHPILGYKRMHSGIDIIAPSGTLVKAADGGEIIQAGYDGGYGNSIMVYHGGGFATWYAHLSRILVSAGQTVERGQVIGLVGSTGMSTGPHLHFEVRINGAAQNPLGFLQ